MGFRRQVAGLSSQTILWSIVFFFAFAGASAARLTVSEIFPFEGRAKAIAVFFVIAQGFGALGPDIYGGLVTSRGLFVAYLVGTRANLVGGLVGGSRRGGRAQVARADSDTAVGCRAPGGPGTARGLSGFAHTSPPVHRLAQDSAASLG